TLIGNGFPQFAGAVVRARRRGEEPDAAVGHNTINIEQEELDFPGTSFGHPAILLSGDDGNVSSEHLAKLVEYADRGDGSQHTGNIAMGASAGAGVVRAEVWDAHGTANCRLAAYPRWKNYADRRPDRLRQDAGGVSGMHRPAGAEGAKWGAA